MKTPLTPTLFANALRTTAADATNQPTPYALDLGFATLSGNWLGLVEALDSAPVIEASDVPGMEY